MDLVDLVCAVFTYQGFTVAEANRRRAPEACGVIVRRGALEIAVAVVGGEVPLDRSAVEALVAELAKRKGARHLIAYGGAPGAQAQSAAALSGAVLWDRERLIAEAGAAFVGLADPDPFRPAEGSRVSQAARDAFGAWPPARAAGPGARVTLRPARAAEGDAALGALAVALSQEAARAAAEGALKARVLRLDLAWVPAFLFDYHLEVEVATPRGGEELLSSGTLLVFASGGEAEEVLRPLEVVPNAAAGAEAIGQALRRRRLTPSAARARAREEALAGAVRTVESVRERGSVTVIERQRWRPKGNTVDLVLRGVLFVPLYLVETEAGAVTLDAATGALVRVAPFAGEALRPGGSP